MWSWVVTEGIVLTIYAFEKYFGAKAAYFIAIAGLLFAFSTMIAWSYYGEIGAGYLFGNKILSSYKIFFVVLSFLGALMSVKLVVNVSDILVAMLAIPNTIALLLLSNKLARFTNEYFSDLKSGKMKPLR